MQVFQNAQELLQGYQVHPEIQAQMFAYLFFFSNVSLFNQLMDKGRAKSVHTHSFSSIRPPSGFVQLLVCVCMRERERETHRARESPCVLVSILTVTNPDLSSMPLSYLHSVSPSTPPPSCLPSLHLAIGVRQRGVEEGVDHGEREEMEDERG